MKQICILLFFVLLLTTCAKAQKDFNYEVFTRKMIVYQYRDSTELHVLRNVKKYDNKLSFVSPDNTGDTEEYDINFIGYRQDDGCFLYAKKGLPPGKRTVFEINPVLPSIVVKNYENGALMNETVYY